jgi:twitching motility protein PilI
MPGHDAVSIFSILLDYDRRSISHVATAPEVSEEPGHWRAVAYRVGTNLLVSAFDQVIEITSVPPMTPVPRAEPWLLGVANARGNLLPIVDFKLFILGERTLLHDGQRMLVVQQSGGMVAVVVDELFGQRFFNDAQLVDEASSFVEGRLGHFVSKAYSAFGKTWGVFDMDLLTRTPEFRQAAA